MLKANSKSFNVLIDALNIISGIKILNGNPVQSFNRDTGEYIDDRSLVPLLILPWASAVDPNKMMPSGEVKLTGVEYYLGSPSQGNRIVSGGDYVISDSGAPTYSLKVKKNTEVDSPYEIYAILMFTDMRTNTTVRDEVSISLYTTYYEASNYSVKLNQPKGFTIDPTRAVRDANGNILINVSAQMYSGKEMIADKNAVYFWYILEGGNYRLLTDDDFFVMSKSGKNLQLNACFFEKLSLKVRAAYRADGDPLPGEPQTDSIQSTTTIDVTLPPTAVAHMRINKGAYIAPGVNTPIECECYVEDNQGIIENPEKYYFCKWFARLLTTGAKPKEVGHGFFLNATSAEIGISASQRYEIYPEVYEKGQYAIATDNLGIELTDNNGARLLIQTIKE